MSKKMTHYPAGWAVAKQIGNVDFGIRWRAGLHEKRQAQCVITNPDSGAETVFQTQLDGTAFVAFDLSGLPVVSTLPDDLPAGAKRLSY